MPNNTTPTEISAVFTNYIKPNYPATNVDNYYNATTLLEVIPAGVPDRLLQHIVELVLNVRRPEMYGYAAPMSNAEVKDLYRDLGRHLQDAVTVLTTIQAAIDTHYAALP